MNTKLYTSRFANKELLDREIIKVGIVRRLPKWSLPYELSGNIIELAPPGYLFNEYDRKKFTVKYFQHLDRVGFNNIVKRLENMGYGQVEKMILLCFEDIRNPELWCHREVFAEWWEQKTGEKIEEYQDNSKNKWKQEEPKEEENMGTQIQLF